MDSITAQQDAANLEDRLRRMILLNGSVPDDAPVDSRPRVRLPPSVPPGYSHQPAGPTLSGSFQHQRLMSESSSLSSNSPSNHGFPPPMNGPPLMFQQPMNSPSPPMHPPGFLPPHLRHPPAQHAGGPSIGPSGPPPILHQNRGGLQRGNGRGAGTSRQQRNQQIQLDPDAFQRGGSTQGYQARPQPGARNLYDPNARQAQSNFVSRDVARQRQARYLDEIVAKEIPAVEMSQVERDEKEAFRLALQRVCHGVCMSNPSLPNVSLECFGSFQSGFASAGSDMDLVIVVPDHNSTSAVFSMLEDDLPRSLEKELLRVGFGARLLTRTRVPIIKICQEPGDSLLDKLREEREKWDFLPNEKKYPHLHKEEDETVDDDALPPAEAVLQAVQPGATNDGSVNEASITVQSATTQGVEGAAQEQTALFTVQGPSKNGHEHANGQQGLQQKREQQKSWTRERKAGPLDFPKDGIGIQCDINFFNPLGLHNTQMLRCYSKCDPRVRPIVLAVKSFAKQRKINSSYSGTLSSYGYVLMVLHYLINVAHPPVLPNLQQPWRPHANCAPPGYSRAEVDGWVVDFWRNEQEIEAALHNGQMSSNSESIGSLLAGFFQYYSSMGNGPQFRWTQQVLSLRTPGGILTKESKGWVKATTEEGEGKKIQHRYLFCIEDPFELSHNVARTVTHNGIVAIRDEFRRAYRILMSVAQGQNGLPSPDGYLFDQLQEAEDHEQEIERRNMEILSANKIVRNEEEDITIQKKKRHGTRGKRGKNGEDSVDGIPQQRKESMPILPPSQLDMADQDAFPTLGAAKTSSRRKKSASGGVKHSNFNEISGDQAAEYLEEFRRKKAEEQAESTAYGAAESVLSGLD
ncbi:putative PAP/25A-associated, polymerase, nucleotidyl transferase domain-containing protein [Septoria linicola]|nr:putative PAP/25A-associated, polymerase, nucleotidyl transferase domain-containing protein [Septoria linicola]